MSARIDIAFGPAPAEYSAKNTHAGAGLPDQPDNYSGRTLMVETPHPRSEHGDGLTVDGAAVVGQYWPYDGPHSPDSVAAAAEAIAELVRYCNNATGPGNGTHTLVYASHVHRVLGCLDAAVGGLAQLCGQLLWASVDHAADPTLYDDRRDRPAIDTAGHLDTALDELRGHLSAVVPAIGAARAHSAHLGHDVDEPGGDR